MKQQLKETITYKPNDEVLVKVDNKPVVDKKTGQIFYEQTITTKVVRKWQEEKLSFRGEDDIRAFLDDIELEDPQQELPL